MSFQWSQVKIPIVFGAILLVMAVTAGPVAAAGASPRNLSVERADGGIHLDWDAPSRDAISVTAYRIERMRPLSEPRFTTFVSNTGNTDTTYLDTSATEDGIIYVYRVRALRGENASSRSNYDGTTWQDPAPPPPAPTGPPPTNFNELCLYDYRAGRAVSCSSGSFGSVRKEASGAYGIDWSAWDADQPDVTGYTITLQRIMVRQFLKADGSPEETDTYNNYFEPDTCRPYRPGRSSLDEPLSPWEWRCDGASTVNEDPSGNPTSPEHALNSPTDVTNWSSSLQSPGRNRGNVTIVQTPTNTVTGPDSVPTEVQETVLADQFEMHIYHVTAHRSDGSSTTRSIAVEGANGYPSS